MDKNVLNEYIDACVLIKETEEDIEKLRRKRQTIVKDSVSGSMNQFPYVQTHFTVEGTPFTTSDDIRLRAEEKLLEDRMARAEASKLMVEEWMNMSPARMQRIIRYRFFEGLSWEQTADKIGRNTTGESVRKEFERFMKEN